MFAGVECQRLSGNEVPESATGARLVREHLSPCHSRTNGLDTRAFRSHLDSPMGCSVPIPALPCATKVAADNTELHPSRGRPLQWFFPSSHSPLGSGLLRVRGIVGGSPGGEKLGLRFRGCGCGLRGCGKTTVSAESAFPPSLAGPAQCGDWSMNRLHARSASAVRQSFRWCRGIPGYREVAEG